MKLLGQKINTGCCLLCVVLGLVIGYFVLCSCARIPLTKESFRTLGAKLDYSMARGIPGRQLKVAPPYNLQLDTHVGPKLPLPEGQLFFFADNTFSPDCCVPPFSGVSSSNGCACMTKEQVDYINMRGGNRTGSSDF